MEKCVELSVWRFTQNSEEIATSGGYVPADNRNAAFLPRLDGGLIAGVACRSAGVGCPVPVPVPVQAAAGTAPLRRSLLPPAAPTPKLPPEPAVPAVPTSAPAAIRDIESVTLATRANNALPYIANAGTDSTTGPTSSCGVLRAQPLHAPFDAAAADGTDPARTRTTGAAAAVDTDAMRSSKTAGEPPARTAGAGGGVARGDDGDDQLPAVTCRLNTACRTSCRVAPTGPRFGSGGRGKSACRGADGP